MSVSERVFKEPAPLPDPRSDRRIGAILVEQMKLTPDNVNQVLEAPRSISIA